MAIVQISKIQHRKGLQQDLPQLASAELGWSIDTRQLYIGNGTISEGAPVEGVTEILTQYSDILNIGNQYIFKGAQSGYTSQTGATALTPVTRTLQQKLDDSVNIRDFGAVGDGITDDTAAIQRAVDQILFGGFALNQPRLRRVIHFPPGIYYITASIKIPSYVFLTGSGAERTIIQQNSTTAPLFQLKDNTGQYGTPYGTLGANTAKYISIQEMTLQHLGAKNIVALDSCDEVNFFRVAFTGAQNQASSTSSSLQNAVYAVPTDSTKPITGLRFIECSFTKCTQGLILNTNNTKIIGCDFTNLSRGVWVDTSISAATTKNVKIVNSTFDNIGRSAIYVSTGAPTSTFIGVTSIGNYYGEVGTDYAGPGNPVYPVISFSGSGNYSIADAFERPDADRDVQPRVYHYSASLNASLTANAGIQTGMITRGTGRVLSLAASQTDANTRIVLTGTTGGVTINYLLQRPSASPAAYRHGTIQVVYNGTHVQYSDEYIEYPNATTFSYGTSSPTGIQFKVNSLGSTQAGLFYSSDSSGVGTFTYSITNFHL
jgi:hypothetical protein